MVNTPQSCGNNNNIQKNKPGNFQVKQNKEMKRKEIKETREKGIENRLKLAKFRKRTKLEYVATRLIVLVKLCFTLIRILFSYHSYIFLILVVKRVLSSVQSYARKHSNRDNHIGFFVIFSFFFVFMQRIHSFVKWLFVI